MVAHDGTIAVAQFGELAGRLRHMVAQEHALRDLVLDLADDVAGAATNAVVKVEYHCVTGHYALTFLILTRAKPPWRAVFPLMRS